MQAQDCLMLPDDANQRQCSINSCWPHHFFSIVNLRWPYWLTKQKTLLHALVLFCLLLLFFVWKAVILILNLIFPMISLNKVLIKAVHADSDHNATAVNWQKKKKKKKSLHVYCHISIHCQSSHQRLQPIAVFIVSESNLPSLFSQYVTDKQDPKNPQPTTQRLSQSLLANRSSPSKLLPHDIMHSHISRVSLPKKTSKNPHTRSSYYHHQGHSLADTETMPRVCVLSRPSQPWKGQGFSENHPEGSTSEKIVMNKPHLGSEESGGCLQWCRRNLAGTPWSLSQKYWPHCPFPLLLVPACPLSLCPCLCSLSLQPPVQNPPPSLSHPHHSHPPLLWCYWPHCHVSPHTLLSSLSLLPLPSSQHHPPPLRGWHWHLLAPSSLLRCLGRWWCWCWRCSCSRRSPLPRWRHACPAPHTADGTTAHKSRTAPSWPHCLDIPQKIVYFMFQQQAK